MAAASDIADFTAAGREIIEFITRSDVLVQARGVELREHVNLAQPAVEAVADRDVHEAVFARERHRRLAPLLGQGKEPRATAAAHDHRQNSFGFSHRGSVLIPCGMI